MKIMRLSGRVRARTGAPAGQPIDLMATRGAGRSPKSGMRSLDMALNGGGRWAAALAPVANSVRSRRFQADCQDLGKNGCLVAVRGLWSAAHRASNAGRASGVSGDGLDNVASGSCRYRISGWLSMIFASQVVPERGAPKIRMGAARASGVTAVRPAPGQVKNPGDDAMRWYALRTLNWCQLV